ncbi:hypothetical protein P153DRAFT_298984 [Dothidotthia symphoricarpi CBS 119687]|uniref:Serine hydrolase domain-containing protein n=1 Tax=Dothidotthia symphoricarpi CBS 119687 TaxID=1392245 RepID=A0A6A6A1E3_9PLEO|nr:uncharacterized protein P153DRAFT_298984 [Dothidotthia symphoricarpi CBS 119687]KAF2125822.1 hypothetical protein P153DRAFT_298984 [Dothidotthia symphoricarpi CBS 119687]
MTRSGEDYNNNNSNGSAKPTLLAFHGSGSNATVHTVQLARLTRLLKQHFEIESLQAPFPSPAGPGILPFFDGCGPFYRWLPPSEKITLEGMRRGDSTSALSPEVESLVRDAVKAARSRGSRVVGLVGFSQGTKVVAGLLRGSEVVRAAREETGKLDEGTEWCDFGFGLSICGSYAPPLVPQGVLAHSGLTAERREEVLGRKIRTPTFHVQGRQDEWKWAGEGLIAGHYEVGEGMSEVVEWEMGHHYPVPVGDSERVRDWMVEQLGRVEGKRV